jgi:hypothetical protein
MLPADRADRTSLQSLDWQSVLRIKQAKVIDFMMTSRKRVYGEGDPNSLFWPSFTLLCDAKEVQRKLFCENEEMIVILEQSDIEENFTQEELGIMPSSEHVTIERFLAYSFRSALAPVATEICKTIVPSLCQNLCMCVDLFEESDRCRIFELFLVNRYQI